MSNMNHELYLILIVLASALYCDTTLIASSEIQYCARKSTNIQPKNLDGKLCNKKFVIALAVENGQVSFF